MPQIQRSEPYANAGMTQSSLFFISSPHPSFSACFRIDLPVEETVAPGSHTPGAAVASSATVACRGPRRCTTAVRHVGAPPR